MKTIHVLAGLLCMLTLGCGEVASTNPFDPSTPSAQQRKGSVAGEVQLPEGFSSENCAAPAELRAGSGTDQSVSLEIDPETEGRCTFHFEEVAGGEYDLVIRLTGLEPYRRGVSLTIGEQLVVPLIELELPQGQTEEEERPVLRGVATLSGAPEGGHSGTLVELVGLPFTTVTGADGAFALEVIPGDHEARFSRSGYGTQAVAVSVPRGEAEVLIEPVVLTGDPAALRGEVLLLDQEENLEALRAVELVLSQAGGETLETISPTDEGRFSFSGLAPGVYELEVRHPGFRTQIRTPRLAPGEERLLDPIALVARPIDETAGRIVGRAVLQGAPEGAHAGIQVRALNTPYEAETDASGAFSLIAPPGRYTVEATFEGYGRAASEAFDLEPGSEASPPELVLTARPGSVSGRVDFDGEAPDIATRRLIDLTLGEQRVEVDPEALTFHFEGVLPGTHTLRASLDGYVAVERPGVAVAPGQARVENLRLSPVGQTAHITGVAQLQGRGNHADIRVELAETAFATRTNGQGFFDLEVPVRNELAYDLRFGFEGYGEVSREVPPLGPEAEPDQIADIVLLTAQPGRVHGLVRLLPIAGGDFEPSWVEEVSVSLVEARIEDPNEVDPEPGEGAAIERTTRPEPDGSYEFENVAPGTYSLRYERESFRQRFETAQVGPGQTVFVGTTAMPSTLADEPPTYVQGVARLDCPGGCEHGGIQVEAEGTPFTAITGADGRFRLQVVTGSYTLVYSFPGFARFPLPEQIEVSVGDTAAAPDVTLQLDPGNIAGRLAALPPRGAEARPLAGVEVAVYQPGAEGDILRKEATTVEEGAFLLDGLREGVYELRVRVPGHAPYNQLVQVLAGRTTGLGPIQLDLLRRDLLVGVQLLGASGERALLVRGSADDPRVAGYTWSATSAGEVLRVRGLPAGVYDLSASAPGFVTEVREDGVIVAVDEEADLEVAAFVLPPRRHGIQVPPVHTDKLVVELERDADLLRYRAWLDEAEEPEAWSPLPAQQPSIELSPRGEGAHRVFLRFANLAFVDEDPSNDVLAYQSPILAAESFRDSAAPELIDVRHVPGPGAEEGYVAFPQQAVIDLIGFDPEPGSGLAELTYVVDDQPAPPRAFAPRLQIELAEAGAHQLRFLLEDAAGNTSAAQALALNIDTAAPTGELAAARGDRLAGLDALLSLALADADDSPLWYRVHDVTEPPGPFLPASEVGLGWDGIVALRLRAGADGPRTIGGQVRDAAGRITALNEVVFTVDRAVASPTGLIVTGPAGVVPEDGRIASEGGRDGHGVSIELRVELAGAGEDVEVFESVSGRSCTILEGQPSCVIAQIPIAVESGDVDLAEIEVYAEDALGNRSATVSTRFTVDAQPPTEPILRVLGGALTAEAAIQVELNAVGAVAYAIGGDVNAVPRTAANFPITRELTLSAGEGDKDLEVTFFDEVDNERRVDATVRLDTEAPAFTAELQQRGAALEGNPPRTADPLIDVVVTPTLPDPDCQQVGRCALDMRLSFTPNFQGAQWVEVIASTALALPTVNGLRQVFIQLRDQAGNVSDAQQLQVNLQVELDREPPGVPGLRRHYIDERKVRLEISPPGDGDLAYYAVERNVPDIDGAEWRPVQLRAATTDDGAVDPATTCAVQEAACHADGEGCLVYDNGGDVLLVEDHGTVPGVVHYYRIRAVDDLGNSSGFSVPLEAGAPMATPAFSFVRGDERRLQWALPEGAFAVDRATLRILDPDGVSALVEEVPAGPGQVELPEFELQEGGVAQIHEFILEVANQDRSITWRSRVGGITVDRKVVTPGLGLRGYEVRSVKDAAGVVHLASRSGMGSSQQLIYTRIFPDGRRVTETSLFPLRRVQQLYLEEATQRVWLLSTSHFLASLRLEPMDGEDPPTELYSENRQQLLTTWGSVAVEEGTVRALHHRPANRTLYYGEGPVGQPLVWTQVSAETHAGREAQLFKHNDTWQGVYLDRGAVGGRQRVMHVDLSDQDRPTSVLYDEGYRLDFGGGDTTRRSLQVVLGTDVELVFRAQEFPSGDHLLIGGRIPRNGGPLQSAEIYRGDAELIEPKVMFTLDPIPRRVIVAATDRPGPDFLFRFESDQNQSFTDNGAVIAQFENDTGFASIEVQPDANGRPRIYVTGEPDDLLEITADFLLETEEAENETRLPPLGDDRGDMLRFHHEQHTPHRISRGPQRNLWARTLHFNGDLLVAGPQAGDAEITAADVSAYTSTPNVSGSEEPYAIYATEVTSQISRVWIRQLRGNPVPEAVELDPGRNAGFVGNGTEGVSNELRLETDAAGAMHSAWIRNNTQQLVYWRRPAGGTINPANGHGGTLHTYDAAALDGLPAQANRGQVLLVVGGAGPRILMGRQDGVIMNVLVADPANPEVQTMDTHLATAILLDAELGADGKIYIAFRAGGAVYLSTFGGAPSLISLRHAAGTDTVDLVAGSDGAMHVFYTETRVDLEGQAVTELRYQRPLLGAEPTAVVLRDFQYPSIGDKRMGVAASAKPGGFFELYFYNADEAPAAGATDQQVHQARVRPGRTPDVTHARVDGLARLGLPQDLDADGVPDGADNCPQVWNPAQADDDGNDRGDLCEPCFSCATVPDLAEVGAPRGKSIYYSGFTADQLPVFAGGCSEDSGEAKDFILAFTATTAGRYFFTTEDSDFDTVLYLLDDDCRPETPQLACNDDSAGLHSELDYELEQGQTVYIVIDGFRAGAEGNFELRVDQP